MSRAAEIVSRAHALLEAVTAFQTVVRGDRQLNEDELPGCVIYWESSETAEARGDRMAMTMVISVRAYKKTGDRPQDDVIDDILGTVRGALEVDDVTLNGLLSGAHRLQLNGFAPIYPEAGGSVAGVQVEYSAPHVSHFGGAQ